MSCLGLSLADRDAASGAEDPDMRLGCPFRQGESPRFCRCPKFRTGRSIAPGRPKVWPSTWRLPGGAVVHGATRCIRGASGVLHGLHQGCISLSIRSGSPLGRCCVRGCFVIRFLLRRPELRNFRCFSADSPSQWPVSWPGPVSLTQRAEYFDGAEGSISDGSLSRGLRSLEGKPSAPFLLELCSSTLDP